MSMPQDVPERLEKLCGLIFGNACPPADERRGIFLRNLELLNNPIFATGGPLDEFKLVESVKKRLGKANQPNASLEFSRLYGKLQEKDLLQNRAGVLKFLLALHQGGKRQDNATPVSFGTSFSSGSSPFPTLPSNATATPSVMEPRFKRPLDSTMKTVNTIGSYRSYQTPVNDSKRPQGSTASLFSERSRSTDSNGSCSTAPDSETRIGARNAFDPGNLSTPDSALLRDIIFILQGIDGQYLRYDKEKEEYYFLPSAVVEDEKKELLLRISEIGYLHGVVKSYCDTVISDGVSMGLIVQAFRSALQDELSDYYKHLAALQAQLDSSECMDQGINTYGMDDDVATDNGLALTIRRLYVSMNGWKHRLIMLASTVEECTGLRGGALLSQLYEETLNGDPDWHQPAIRLFASAFRPFAMILAKWIYEGVLEDPCLEFFIDCKQSTGDNTVMWREKFSLREEMIPSFINENLAHEVLLAGKSLNCLPYMLKENQPRNSLDTHRQDMKTVDVLPIATFRDRLPAEINARCSSASTLLVSTFKELYHVDKFLAEVRDIVMVTCFGEVPYHWDAYQDDGITHLQRYVEVVNDNFLNSVFAGTRTFRWRLDLKKANDEADGWALILGCQISWPLDIMITEQHMTSYGRMYRFFLELECARTRLARLQLSDLVVSSKKVKRLLSVQRFQVFVFLTKIMTAMSYEFFGHFDINDIVGSSSIDNLCEKHDKTVEDLLSVTLSDERSASWTNLMVQLTDLSGKIESDWQSVLLRDTNVIESQQTFESCQIAFNALLKMKYERST